MGRGALQPSATEADLPVSNWPELQHLATAGRKGGREVSIAAPAASRIEAGREQSNCKGH